MKIVKAGLKSEELCTFSVHFTLIFLLRHRLLPKAVTPSNKHTLCQWLFVRPPIDCVILSLWKNTSSGTINYKLLLHTSLAWCCLHLAVIGRSKAEPRSKGRKLLKRTRHHPLQSTKKFWIVINNVQNFTKKIPSEMEKALPRKLLLLLTLL